MTRAESWAERMRALNIPVTLAIISTPQPPSWATALLRASEQRARAITGIEDASKGTEKLYPSAPRYTEPKQSQPRPWVNKS